MELSSRFAGVASTPYIKHLTARDTMNFAAAIGDGNPHYFNDERPGGIMAPPTMPVRLTWRLASSWDEYWELKDFPEEVRSRQVHYTEHLKLHRPIRPGDTITTAAAIVAITPHAAGTHMVLRFDGENQRGEAVFTEFAGAMLRDVKCVDGAQGKDKLPAAPRLPGGLDPLWERVYHVDPFAAHIYDAGADIHFPIHTSVQFAHEVGLPDIILHGTATMSYAVRELVDAELDGDPTRVAEIGCRFTGMVLLDTDITIRALGRVEHDDRSEIFFEVRNADDERVIRNGFLVASKAGGPSE